MRGNLLNAPLGNYIHPVDVKLVERHLRSGGRPETLLFESDAPATKLWPWGIKHEGKMFQRSVKGSAPAGHALYEEVDPRTLKTDWERTAAFWILEG